MGIEAEPYEDWPQGATFLNHAEPVRLSVIVSSARLICTSNNGRLEGREARF